MQNYNLPSVNRGNTFGGVEFQLPAGQQFDLEGAAVKIQVRKTTNATVVKELASPADITIIPPSVIRLNEHLVDIPSGVYKWDMKITFSDTREKTYIGGDWVINPVITL